MKTNVRAFLFTLLFTFLCYGCVQTQAQPKQYADYSRGSGFTVTNADSVSVENLEVLAKV
jgi:hypothetical protein